MDGKVKRRRKVMECPACSGRSLLLKGDGEPLKDCKPRLLGQHPFPAEREIDR